MVDIVKAPAPAPPNRLRLASRVLDGLVVLGVVALFAFPVLARVAADRLPVAPRPAVTLPVLAAGPAGAPLQQLPAGLRPGPTATVLADLRPAATALLGARRGERLLREVRTETTPTDYEYGFPLLERLIPESVDHGAATDLGARLTLLSDAAPVAAAAAYVLFTRAGDDCAARVNLVLLHAAEQSPNPGAVTTAAAAAQQACPGDPTPGWLLGQFQSQDDPYGPAVATFAALRRDFPGSAAAWSGEADALLRRAYVEPDGRPFATRRLYERALAGYHRAERLREPEAVFGGARALAGLGRPAEAAALQQRAIAARAPSAPLQAGLVVYLESARRFPEAAAAARTLGGLADAFPAGPGLFPVLDADHALPALNAADARGPISVGAGRLKPFSVSLGRPDTLAESPVADLSFMPVFRPSPGLTGSERWCADWARRRDDLLAGRAEQARSALPAAFEPIGEVGGGCLGSPRLIAGLAGLELGETGSDTLHDERQNLWRWAGDLPHAESAARGWAQARGDAVLPLIRLGEIEFLRGRFDEAARHFGTGARRARGRDDRTVEAEALVKRGAALLAAKRTGEGLAALRAADDTAARTRTDDPQEQVVARSWSYYARAQLADAEREAGALAAAADDYAAARALGSGLDSDTAAFRIAHLSNNAAIVELALGNAALGLKLAHRARAIDPGNPVYEMTAASAAEQAGRDEEAIRHNGAALAADPTVFPAANDLGVLLARRGRDDAAVAALRRAVGANERYALGWFNLGVVLAGMGPRHLPASQGALARAYTLDPALRDRERRATLDKSTYRTGLDVSRPLPPEWQFAETQGHAPERTAGLAAVLLLAFALARTLGMSRSARGLAQTWLGPLTKAIGWIPVPAPLRHPAVAIAGTLVVLLWPLARDPSGGLTAAVAGALGVVLLVAVAERARAAVARRANEPGTQETWGPGLVFGLGTSAAGFTWAPLPVLRAAGPRVLWAAPVALACVALPLVVVTAWLDIPLSRAVAAAALVMAASLLTPIKPVDGGALAATGGTAAGLSGLGLAALLLLGLV